ncbi:PspC domain-containing protein [Lacisediminihabitans changchengi]|uniref:PspC domain-containing protein n=1 Tax=Lacisediminihabitans changchengi TaxID=2787634 RepID=A0A934VZE9_9MICO|nr:PspC domain-containing protein [Lacisediminihabitans changchengi]MBK4349082.1 PspC domain-containing protein [Lacisediminihabitans changchengi]
MATTASDAPPTTPPPPPAENRFFAWVRLLDVPRRPGWLGGVCAGVAYRLGIDPLIVRGIAVVVAILGGPVFLLYAAGWLLLPDLEGRIHLQRLIQGIFDRALVGIVAVFVLGLLPVTQGFWALSAGYWGDGSVFGAVQRAFWTLIVIAAAIVVTIWIARATQAAAATPTATPAADPAPPASPGPTASPATTDDHPATIPALGVVPLTVASPAAAPAEPVAPATGAGEDEVASWRERQAEWKVQFDAWKAAQAADAKEQRLRRQAETRTRAAQAAAASAERRHIRRLNNPRLGGALTTMVLGLALLAGGIGAVVATGSANWRGAEVATGLAAATVVVGVGIVLAGAFKRKAGFLRFVSVLLLVATVTAGFVPRDRQFLGVRESVSQGDWMQLGGRVKIFPVASTTPAVIDLWQGAGSVTIAIPDDVTVRVATTQRDDNSLDYITVDGTQYSTPTHLAVDRSDDESTYDHTFGPGRPDVTVRVWQGAGTISILQNVVSTTTEGTN